MKSKISIFFMPLQIPHLRDFLIFPMFVGYYFLCLVQINLTACIYMVMFWQETIATAATKREKQSVSC